MNPGGIRTNMKIIIDLSGLNTEDKVLHKFGEVFEFGGPGGNIPANGPNQGKGWGFNWDAMNDSFRSLGKGGIWGTSKKFNFPLEIEIINYQEFQESNTKGFQIMQEILKDQAEEYSKEGKILKIIYS